MSCYSVTTPPIPWGNHLSGFCNNHFLAHLFFKVGPSMYVCIPQHFITLFNFPAFKLIEWNNTACLWCLASFTQHYVCEICPYDLFFFHCFIVFCCINIPQCIYTFSSQWIVRWLPFGAIINIAAMNIPSSTYSLKRMFKFSRIYT